MNLQFSAQTRKALELGAPIENHNYTFGNNETCTYLGKDYTKLPALDWFAQQPTAEQMIAWLRKQGIYIMVPIPLIKDFNKTIFQKQMHLNIESLLMELSLIVENILLQKKQLLLLLMQHWSI